MDVSHVDHNYEPLSKLLLIILIIPCFLQFYILWHNNIKIYLHILFYNMLQCVTNSKILRASLEFVSENDYDMIIENEFKTMCTRFGLNESEMITLVTTLDISLLNTHYYTIWDSLNYYSMDCMDEFKNAYIKMLYKFDFKDERIETLCDDLREYIKCNSCINVNTTDTANACKTFVVACDRGHDECVKYLLNNPKKHDCNNDMFNVCYNYRNTNLVDYLCLCGGSLNIIKYVFEVLNKKCTINAIDLACWKCNCDVIKYLFETHHVDYSKTCMNNAIYHGRYDIVKYLFEEQYKDCSERDLGDACKRGHLDIVKYLFEVQNKNCSSHFLDLACLEGNIDVVKYLFEVQNKDCSERAIEFACQNGHIDIVKYLFEVQNKNCSSYAVDLACQNNHIDIVKYLFEVQNKNCSDNGIYLTRRKMHLNILEYLFKEHNRYIPVYE